MGGTGQQHVHWANSRILLSLLDQCENMNRGGNVRNRVQESVLVRVGLDDAGISYCAPKVWSLG